MALPTIQELRERRAGLKHQMSDILGLQAKEERELTEDERIRFDCLEADAKKHGEQIAQREADDKRRLSLEGLGRELDTPTGRRSTPDVTSTLTIPAEPKAAGFASLGEQLQAIANAGMQGDNVNSRDQRLQWQTLAPSGAAANVPSDGGYLIQKDFSTELLKRMNDIGELKSRVRTIPIGPNSDGLKLFAVDETSRATGSRWGGVQVYWGAEADVATAKKPKFRQMELELKELIGLAYATNRLLADASAVESVFMQAFSEEMTFMIEDSLINGTGAGMPLGILNSAAVVSVAKETGQAAATVTFENIQKMWGRLWARSRANAVWLINQDCESQLNSMTLSVGTGGVPVYLPPGGLSQSPLATLMGRPVVPVEYCAALGTTGDILLADLSQVIAIEKGGMQSDSSIHVKFTSNEMTFRFIYRYDAQPVWHSALTPFKGSLTKSPYVKLDTRS
jgi:HK97 family phage major capsid protein